MTQLLFLGQMIPALMHGVWWQIVLVGLIYTLSATEGSVVMMRFLLKRSWQARVGASRATTKREVPVRAFLPAFRREKTDASESSLSPALDQDDRAFERQDHRAKAVGRWVGLATGLAYSRGIFEAGD